MRNSTSLFPNNINSSVTPPAPNEVYVDFPHKISDLGYIAVASLLSFVWVFGTISNVISLIVFASNKTLRSPTNLFVMSLNLCDLFMCCFGTFMAMTSSWSKRWLYGHTGCVIEGKSACLIVVVPFSIAILHHDWTNCALLLRFFFFSIFIFSSSSSSSSPSIP